MSISRRKDSTNQYLYRSVRIDGHVKKIHIGAVNCATVELAYRSQLLKNAVQESERAKRLVEAQLQTQAAPAFQLVANIAARWRCLESLFLTCPDFDRYKSLDKPFNWVGNPKETIEIAKELSMSKNIALSELNGLLKRVEKNDPEALAILSRRAAEQRELFAATVDLVEIGRNFLLTALGEPSQLSRKAVEARMDAVRSELGRDQASDGLERLLIDVCMLTYMNSLKCGVLSLRAIDTQKGAKFWASMASRAAKDIAVATKALTSYRTRLRRRSL